jgi:hypothetical protein
VNTKHRKSFFVNNKNILLLLIVLVFLSFNILADTNLSYIENVNLSSNQSINRFNIVCGNSVCELGENIYNCPEDCFLNTFRYKTNLISIRTSKGSSNIYDLEIKNLLKTQNNEISLSVDGMITDLVIPSINSFTLEPNEEKYIELSVEIPDDLKIDTYVGGITIHSGDRRTFIPITIDVMDVGESLLTLDLRIINKNLKEEDILLYQENIYVYENDPKDLKISYALVNLDTRDVFYSNEKELTVRGSSILTDSINLSNLDKKITEGQYYLEGSIFYKGKQIVTTDNFDIIVPFWTPFRIRLSLAITFLIAISFLGLISYQRYRKWKLSKMRYILPNLNLLPKKDDSNLWVGKIPETTKRAYFSPRDLCTHALVAGSTGSGKSVTASVIVESVLEKKIPVIIFDPTAQWTGFVKQCKDKNILKYYAEFGFSEDSARSYKGLIYNVYDPYINLDIKKYMNPGEVTVFNLNYLKPGEYDQAVMNIINKMFQVPWDEHPTLKLLLVFDEVHRLLEKYGGKGGYIALEKACREFRKWGIGLVMASQVSTDFKEAVAGNILTEIQMNTKSMEDIQKISQKYGPEFSSKITRQGIGVGMIQNPLYNNGKPWFVHFRPPLHDPHKISEEDLKTYSDYSFKLDEIEAKLELLKSSGKNVSDIFLEYKLTRDKLKEGHFKMVDIYLNSLETSLNKLE